MEEATRLDDGAATSQVRQGAVLPSSRFSGSHMPCKFNSHLRGSCVVCTWRFGGTEAQKSKTDFGCEDCNRFLHLECYKSWHRDEEPVLGKREKK